MRALTLLLAACGAPGDSADSASPETGAEERAPLPEPTWSAEEVGFEIDAALALGIPDPKTMLGIFQGMWAGADDSCPQQMGDYNMVLYISSCLSDHGWTFEGVSTYEPEEDGGFWLLGDGAIIDADGATFTASGELELTLEPETGWSSRMAGIWGYPASDVPWVASVPSLALWGSGSREGTQLDGGWDAGGVHLHFEALTVVEACPTGLIWLRDPQGVWYQLTLDDTCSGCGAVRYGEEELGEACVAVEPAVSDLAHRME